ncbi:hypothetical protein EV360DRAFT_68406 [Lentinula raphanica]|nr:hypothetical protein EV360DRAFT_68406 [Lentinula raphanica]
MSMFRESRIRDKHSVWILFQAVLATARLRIQIIRASSAAATHLRKRGSGSQCSTLEGGYEELARQNIIVFLSWTSMIKPDKSLSQMHIALYLPLTTMEPVNESSDDETSSTSHSVWWKRKIYDHATYRLDSDGMIQKIYHDPDSEELNAKTRGRTKTPPPRGGLKKSENSTFVRDGDRGSTPVSFKPLARPAKYFVQGARTSNITNEPFGPTKLEMSPFKSSDSEGHNAWHSSQSPHDLDAPLPETPTPRMVGTTYVHRNTSDGGYQIWVWCSREGGDFTWHPVDLNNEQFAHPKISNRSLKLTLTGKPSWVLNKSCDIMPAVVSRHYKSWHVLHEVVDSCDHMNNRVSQTLIRDSEGWFVLMDVEESPAAVWHHQELMGWRDSKKLIESEDETADHGSRSDSDTESHISMNPSTHSHILDPAKRTEPERVTKDMAVTHDRTPIIGNGTIQLPEQKSDESTIKNGIQEPSPSNPSSDCSSEKGTYMGDNLQTFNAFTGVTVMTNNGSGAEAVQSPKAPVGHRLLEATDSSSFPPNTTNSSHDQEPQSMTQRSFTLEEFLNRFGDFIMVESPIPQALFKVGSLMYLLFLIRVLWKIWAMFRSQPLAVGFGNLGISVALLFLLRLWVPEHSKVQVDQVGTIAYRF